MPRLFVDFETFSTVDLKTAGASRYARHPSTKVLMVAWAIGNGRVNQWSFEDGPFPAELVDLIRDPAYQKSAWNAPFEMQIFEHVLGVEIDPTQWYCTMALAMTLALPGSLDKCGPVVDLPVDKRKDARGKALITKFTKPRKPSKHKPWTRNLPEHEPFDWLDFLTYNRQDIEAERAIWNRLRAYEMGETERAIWLLDREINSKGFPVNMAYVRNAVAVKNKIKGRMIARMNELTGLSNSNSPAQLLPWLKENGYPFDDLKKGHIERAMERAKKELAELGDNYRAMNPEEVERQEVYAEVLYLRSQSSKTSVTKYDALVRSVDTDGFLRNGFQFAGAGRTNRWAGRLFQAQNLARPDRKLEKMLEKAAEHLEVLDAEDIELVYEQPMELLSTGIRGSVQAPKGFVFADADLSAIENIVLGWMSGEQKILSVFEKKRDPYIDFGQYMYGASYEHLWDEYKNQGKGEKRQICKPGVLGCGYMLSAGEIFENEDTGEFEATGLLGYAWNMGVKTFTLDDSKHSVKTWRETYTEAVAYWATIERAARKCIATGQRTEAGPVEFRLEPPFLRMYLPSGRALSYCRPRIEPRKTPWGAIKDTITYEQKNDRGGWSRITTHPGKLTENADQAIARDLLAHGMLLAKKEGLDIRLHVHDQILTLCREERAAEEIRILQECMTTRPSWAPTIPLKTGGFTSRIFMKD